MDSRLRRPAVAAPHIELMSVASARTSPCIPDVGRAAGVDRARDRPDLADVQPNELRQPARWTAHRPPSPPGASRRGAVGSSAYADSRTASRNCGASTCRPGAGPGVARRLVNEALRAADLMGAASVYVETAPWSMPTAVRLLRRLRFTEGASGYMATIDRVVAMQRLVGPPPSDLAHNRLAARIARAARSDEHLGATLALIAEHTLSPTSCGSTGSGRSSRPRRGAARGDVSAAASDRDERPQTAAVSRR